MSAPDSLLDQDTAAAHQRGQATVGAKRAKRLDARGLEASDGVRDTNRSFTDYELVHVVEVARQAGSRADVADLVLFLRGTGCRIAEALAVRWDDLTDDLGMVHVRGTKSSTSDRKLGSRTG